MAALSLAPDKNQALATKVVNCHAADLTRGVLSKLQGEGVVIAA